MPLCNDIEFYINKKGIKPNVNVNVLIEPQILNFEYCFYIVKL